METHEKFRFDTLSMLRDTADRLGVDIRFDEDLALLKVPVKVAGKTAPNAMAVLPMEGCDCGADGAPSALTERRYLRFAAGGSGLLWWEACAVVPEGRANPQQMMLTKGTLDAYRKLLQSSREAAMSANGYAPLNILQLTHSGRYSRPEGHRIRPLAPQHDPILDPLSRVNADTPLVSDAYLESLVDRYVQAAKLAREAGFDGVDVKACHRYLLSELLACHTRDGRYGGSFGNRSRLLLDIVGSIRAAAGDGFIVACRFNVFDAHPYPYGFGCGREDMWRIDFDESDRLVTALVDRGVSLLGNSAGNPYYIYPQVTRPFDASSEGIPIPEEHPLESVERLFTLTRRVQKAAGSVPVVGNGYSWLRQYLSYAGAANLKDGACAFVGLGRSSFAYPDAPRDILHQGAMDARKCCISCSKCTQIMRDHGMTGCVVRDKDVYAPLYRRYRQEALERTAAAKL